MMQQHIDISSVLRQTLACDLYSNLVTRKTGAAVRGQIEQLLGDAPADGRALTVIDFSHVSMIDFSCADEVVAKLLLRYSDEEATEVYFLFRGVTDDHWDAIEAVLERHGLALAMESGDDVRVVGALSEGERRAWEATYRLGDADADGVAAEMGSNGADALDVLEALWRRRLIMRVNGRYVAVGGPRHHG